MGKFKTRLDNETIQNVVVVIQLTIRHQRKQTPKDILCLSGNE